MTPAEFKNHAIAHAETEAIAAVIEKYKLPNEEAFMLYADTHGKVLKEWATKEKLEEYIGPNANIPSESDLGARMEVIKKLSTEE